MTRTLHIHISDVERSGESKRKTKRRVLQDSRSQVVPVVPFESMQCQSPFLLTSTLSTFYKPIKCPVRSKGMWPGYELIRSSADKFDPHAFVSSEEICLIFTPRSHKNGLLGTRCLPIQLIGRNGLNQT